ncbi:MAG: M48 family metalloprotease [Pseudomonadota bacterium]
MLLISLLAAPPTAHTIQLPDLGTSADRAMSPEQEARIGADFLRNLRQHVEIVDDPEIRAYVRSLGNRLASRADGHQPDDFHFFVVNDSRINAFAAPGGYIGVNAGLILAAREEDELAGVVAHEIAHVTQRHLARAREASDDMSVPMAASILAAILLGGEDPQLGQAALAATIAGSTQYQISFTRSNEREADRVGMEMLASAGFDPEGMPSFFERLQANNRFGASVVPEFLMTHPVTLNRIADGRNRARQMDYNAAPDHGDFKHIQARLQVMVARDASSARESFEEAVEEEEDAPWARYGLALALARDGETERGLALIEALREANPDRLAYRLAEGRLLQQLGEDERALARFRATLDLFPGNEATTIHLAESLLTIGSHREARDLLRDYVRRHARGPNAFRLLARAEAGSGDVARYHAALAEYYSRGGRAQEAIRQLRHALAASRDDRLDQRLEARLEELRRQARIDDELERIREEREE